MALKSSGQPADGSIIRNRAAFYWSSTFDVASVAVNPLSAQNSALTLAAWIKPSALQRNSAICSRRDGRNAVVINMDDGAPFVELTVSGTARQTAASAPCCAGRLASSGIGRDAGFGDALSWR